MTDETILAQLLSPDSCGHDSWQTFLQRFSNLILKMIWQFEKDYDEAMEKYLFVCRKLAEKDFAILRRYKQLGERSPQFTTWLAAVTRNLCIDAHRATHGRRQLPRAILRLSAFDQKVFDLYYWKGCSVEELEHRLGSQSESSIAEALGRIQHVLVRSVHREPEMLAVHLEEDDERFGSSELEHDMKEMLMWLARWLDELGDQERMIIRLRFWEGMTGSEIARAMRISPEQRVYPLLQRAVDRLRERATATYSERKTRSLSV